MNKDEIKKALTCCKEDCCSFCPHWCEKGCQYQTLSDALNLITEQEKEIERLKAENEELTKVVSSKVYDFIDNTKEIADAREAWEQQAKIDVLNELWKKVKDEGVDYKIGMRALSEEIDELIKEQLKK